MDEELLSAVQEIRDLLRVMAEPAIAERDKKLREDLREIIGTSAQRAKAVMLMDGTRIQAVVGTRSGMSKGNLSVLVKRLSEKDLLTGDRKQPKLTISLPANFFERGA
jgi:hypothetical protein